jgi:DNA gyrase/topoisomerase IV subunit A
MVLDDREAVRARERIQLIEAWFTAIDNIEEVGRLAVSSNDLSEFTSLMASRYGLEPDAVRMIAELQVRRLFRVNRADLERERAEREASL